MEKTSRTESPAAMPGFEPLIALSASLAAGALQAQRIQLETFFAWQKSLAALGQDAFDGWVCRFGGGAPIDG